MVEKEFEFKMDEELCFQSTIRSSRDQFLRKIVVQAILELETEMTNGEEEKFRDFKASIILRLFSIKQQLQDAIPFDSEFYSERILPKINAILDREFALLENFHACTETDVTDAYIKLRKQVENLIQRRRALATQIQSNRELLSKTLRHEQWGLRFKLQQAEVDYTVVTAAIYEKKFANVAKSIYNIFRDYRYEEAIEAVREKLEKEKVELKKELDHRVKKHEIYEKALALNPDLNDLLEKYQTLTDAITNMQKMELT